jgi:acyl-CoA synthetase (AMP-forming)/AMP-acid ligase II
MIASLRLLPSMVDEMAVADPHRILYSVQKTKDILEGFQDITASTFARAVNRCAWHIEANIGRAGRGFLTLTYMGPQGVVYAILILACIKTGYKLLLR